MCHDTGVAQSSRSKVPFLFLFNLKKVGLRHYRRYWTSQQEQVLCPPIGFYLASSIEFIPGGDDFSAPAFPLANICVNCIKLPLHVSYQLFNDKFDFPLN